MPVATNATLASLGRVSRRGLLNREAERALTQRYVDRLRIKTSSVWAETGTLSGGNQQKVALARLLHQEADVLLLDEPTRGIDVGAKAEIMGQVMDLCDRGMAVLFISSEMDEVLRYSDRVAVMRDRRKVAELASSEADEHTVFQIIAGGQT
jgi:simple sugar transport system ATP-binding protein